MGFSPVGLYLVAFLVAPFGFNLKVFLVPAPSPFGLCPGGMAAIGRVGLPSPPPFPALLRWVLCFCPCGVPGGKAAIGRVGLSSPPPTRALLR